MLSRLPLVFEAIVCDVAGVTSFSSVGEQGMSVRRGHGAARPSSSLCFTGERGAQLELQGSATNSGVQVFRMKNAFKEE